MLQQAQKCLQDSFPSIVFGEIEETKPFGMPENIPNFLNQLAFFISPLPHTSVETQLKQIEKTMGRTASDKHKGEIPIDLDLLKINDQIVRPSEWKRPYLYNMLRKFNFAMALSSGQSS